MLANLMKFMKASMFATFNSLFEHVDSFLYALVDLFSVFLGFRHPPGS